MLIIRKRNPQFVICLFLNNYMLSNSAYMILDVISHVLLITYCKNEHVLVLVNVVDNFSKSVITLTLEKLDIDLYLNKTIRVHNMTLAILKTFLYALFLC